MHFKFILITEQKVDESVEIYVFLASTTKCAEKLPHNNLQIGTNILSRIQCGNVHYH